jgi:carbon monoxide dehydrogenase subunit G
MMSGMKFRHELSYDAPPDQVFEMLADPEFRRAACEAQEVISVDVSLERDGEGFNLVVDQQQNTKDLPGFARTFAGDSTQAIQREVWLGPTGGNLSIEAPGKPTSATGTIRLEEAGSGTREIVELEIKVKVPLIGGKLEKLIAEKVTSGMDIEHAVGTAWLKEH